jgi:hypothetical protein
MTQATRERQLRWEWGLAAAALVALAFRLVHFTDRSLWYEFGFYHSVHRRLFVFHLRSAGGKPAREELRP